ncbi:hypothetical protein ATCV1_Z073R [Acanthocystis turfacea chlorella virus 1]|uniref:Uncharacterized protein Z073R n=1 Tax=Chlorovirus heliozoae TaxID=322019 RepID=A7K833_9PHYC|nr:hypothetical protein ATCV1_Z073R [Acanthocystis turfacea chlorella virus 1]ABT16207.1 hypothetical protein ATCV1_Z073R [Acanthocystis turfacea chlorella virus 1]
MLDFVIVLLIVLMVTIVGYSESKYLFAKPSCTTCGTGTIGTVPEIKKEFSKALQAVKQQTNEIKTMLTKSAQSTKAAAPLPVDIIAPVEHLPASGSIVLGANAVANTIDEDLPFSDYHNMPVRTVPLDGTIQGVRPPTYADPRVMNPSLAAAPVQFPDPAQFGTFGVTDDTSPAFSTPSQIPKTNAKIASDVSLEGFENALDANGARLVMDGKVVKSECQLPSYQLKGVAPHTSLPERSLFEPPATVSDFVDGEMFSGLQGFPIDEKLDPLVAPGIALPPSEWAAINYGTIN